MHPHHARALRVARRNYKFCQGVVDKRIEAYKGARLDYFECGYPSAWRYVKVKDAKRRLELALVELQNQLSVLIIVERLLEKA